MAPIKDFTEYGNPSLRSHSRKIALEQQGAKACRTDM
jgi:hypothetical protein